MQLSPAQLDAFDRDGNLFFAGLFRPDEALPAPALVTSLDEREAA